MNPMNSGQTQANATSYNNSASTNADNMLNSYDAQTGQAAQASQSVAAAQAARQPQNTQAQAANNSGAQQAAVGQAKAVVGIFGDLSSAEQSVTQLRNSGFTTEEINIVSKKPSAANDMENDSVMDGTMTGGAIGGIGGLLLSAGALTIPGLGPIMAAGPLAATIAGAIGGGVTGGLIDWGIPSDKSEEYNEEVSSGNTLAVIKTPENKVAQAVQILTANGAMNVETHNAK